MGNWIKDWHRGLAERKRDPNSRTKVGSDRRHTHAAVNKVRKKTGACLAAADVTGSVTRLLCDGNSSGRVAEARAERAAPPGAQAGSDPAAARGS